MNITEEKLRENFAHNLSVFRRQSGMTQLELAEKLNYSDKSVSKWERAEGIPDLFVVSSIAELFGVTVNDMINDKEFKKPLLFRNKIMTTLLSVGIVWLVATVIFFFFRIISDNIFKEWLIFIYALPISAVVLVVFTSIWWSKLSRFFSISLLVWTIPLSIFLTFLGVPNMYFIFVIAAVVQILAIFWFLMIK
ncbi:MAG: helix-turn-helix domain-containing protein [Clostridia bacterium]|nr:helix-turn-helix domain-containing protein [Clostridia bacterium]